MSATARSTPITGQIDRNWVDGVMTRWKVAEEYVSYLDLELLPAEHALRQVIGQDFPKVIRELTRLCPDLL